MTDLASDDRRRFIGMSVAAGVAIGAMSEAAQDRSEEAASRPVYLAIYRPGPAWIVGQPLAAQPLEEHGQHLLALFRKGVLRYAGPFADESGGAAVIEADDDAAANALIAADPTVIGRVLTFQLYGWKLRPWAQYAAQQDAALRERSR